MGNKYEYYVLGAYNTLNTVFPTIRWDENINQPSNKLYIFGEIDITDTIYGVVGVLATIWPINNIEIISVEELMSKPKYYPYMYAIGGCEKVGE